MVNDYKVHSKNGLLTTVAYKFGNEKAVYALEGSIAVAGIGYNWIQNNLKAISDINELSKLFL